MPATGEHPQSDEGDRRGSSDGLPPAEWWHKVPHLQRKIYARVVRAYKPHCSSRDPDEKFSAANEAIIAILQASNKNNPLLLAPPIIDRRLAKNKDEWDNVITTALVSYASSKDGWIFRAVMQGIYAARTGVKNKSGTVVYGGTFNFEDEDEESGRSDENDIGSDRNSEERFESEVQGPSEAEDMASSPDPDAPENGRPVIVRLIRSSSGVAEDPDNRLGASNPEEIAIRNDIAAKVEYWLCDESKTIEDPIESERFLHFITTLFRATRNSKMGDDILRGGSYQLRQEILLPLLRTEWPHDDWSPENYTRARDKLRGMRDQARSALIDEPGRVDHTGSRPLSPDHTPTTFPTISSKKRTAP